MVEVAEMESKEMSEPIRVLHVLQRMEAAGVQTFLMSLYRRIDRNIVQFDFLVHYETPQFFDDEIEQLGGHVYRLTFREDYDLFKYLKDLDIFFERHPEYKVVHGHMHSLGAIYLYYAKKHGIQSRIAHSHTNNTQNDKKKILKLLMNRLYAKDATELFACSSNAGEYMFGDKSFRVINNAIDSNHFSFSRQKRETKRKELGIDHRFVIGSVGRFELQKNQKFAVEVFEAFQKKHQNSVLLLIGSGSMEQEIRNLVISKGLKDSVMFLGNRRDVAELYQAMDVFLMPSLFEGLGIVAVEAQAAGTPVVCTDTLPKEIDVSPLIHRVSLNEREEVWATRIIEAASHPMSHMDMKSYIIEADYDMTMLADKMQEFYLSKYNHEEP